MIHFTKAHACGNDFLIVDAASVPARHYAAAARQLCARTTGVGADGVEFFEWLGEQEARIHLRNADGSVAEISGNGTRCVAAWMAQTRQAATGTVFRIETNAGPRACRLVSATSHGFELVTAMGTPHLKEAEVRLADNITVAGIAVDTGNPHFVVFTEHPDFSVGSRSWQSLGEEIGRHIKFPQQTNVEFVRVRSPHAIEIRIFERGVGPTTSSGTGTCAAATASIAYRGCESPLQVQAPGGSQQVRWSGGNGEIELSGPAVLVAEGTAYLSFTGAAGTRAADTQAGDIGATE